MPKAQFCAALWVGSLLCTVGSDMVIHDRSMLAYGHFEVPPIAGWGFMGAGACMLCLALLGLYRNWGKKSPSEIYTEEDITRAEASLDALYLSTHGKYPDKSGTILQPDEGEKAQSAAGEKSVEKRPPG